MRCRRGLAMRILSVCPSVCQTRGSWQNGRKICQNVTPYERSFSVVFWRMAVGGDPFYLKFLVNRPPLERNRRFSTEIRSYSGSAVTPSEKSSINTHRKSTVHFLLSLRWSSYVAPKPPNGAQKCKTAVFRVKSHFAWRKSTTKFLYVKLSATKL